MADFASYQHPVNAVVTGFTSLAAISNWGNVVASFSALKAFYFSLDPFLVLIIAALLVAAYCWIASLITGDHSQVDRLWSIIPFVYSWIFPLHAWYNAPDQPQERLLLMAVLVTVWGLRLTFNFARKGGYSRGGEDYRWPILRARMNAVVFALFNLLFIAFYQNVLLAMIVFPCYVAYKAQSVPLNIWDVVMFAAGVLCVVLETIADQQQWNFQSEKYRLKGAKQALKGDYADGFIHSSGLWYYSRHPNFFFEQSVWFALYGFSVTATCVALNWSAIGAVLLVLLFQGSMRFTESLTAPKYPKYEQYQQTTSPMMPWFVTSAKPKQN